MKKLLLAILLIFAFGDVCGAQTSLGGNVTINTGGGAPTASTPIVYAAPSGSDSADCLTWATACKSVMGAYDKLSTTGGTVNFTDNGTSINACKDTDPSGCGIWIIKGSTNDPNYNAIPGNAGIAVTGFSWATNKMTYTFGSGSFVPNQIVSVSGASPAGCNVTGLTALTGTSGTSVVVTMNSDPTPCSGGVIKLPGWRFWKTNIAMHGYGTQQSAGSFEPMVVINGGSGSNPLAPLLWLNNVASFEIDHWKASYQCVDAFIGADTTGNYINPPQSSSWEIHIDNSSLFPNSVAGCGPTVIFGTNNFDDWITNSTISGNAAERVAISSIARASNTVTLTATGNLPSDWSALSTAGALIVHVEGSKDDSLNGAYSATVTGATTLTYSNYGPDVSPSLSSNPVVASDQACGAVVSYGNGDGDVTFDHDYFPGGGSVCGKNSSGIRMIRPYQELAFMPLLNFLGDSTFSYIETPQIADTTMPGVRSTPVNGPNSGQFAGLVAINTTVAGPAQLVAGSKSWGGTAATNQQSGSGDTSRRSFGPVAPPSGVVNKVTSWKPANWGDSACGNQAAGTPITAPDGTQNAGSIANTGSNMSACFFRSSISLTTGDYFVYGGWEKLIAGASFGVSGFILNGGGTTEFINIAGGGQYPTSTAGAGSTYGDWQFVINVAKYIGPTTSQTLSFYMENNTNGVSLGIFAPVLYYFPTSTYTAAEVASVARSLGASNPNCTAAQSCLLPGEQFRADAIQHTPLTWGGSTPTCSTSVNYGVKEFIVDGSTGTWGATVAGNGSNKVWVGCNGTNWVVD